MVDYDKWLQLVGPEIACPLLRKRRQELVGQVAEIRQVISMFDKEIARLMAVMKTGNGNGGGKPSSPTNGNGRKPCAAVSSMSTATATLATPKNGDGNGNGHITVAEVEAEMCARIQGRLRRANGKPVGKIELWRSVATYLRRKHMMATGRPSIMQRVLREGPFRRQNGGWINNG